MKQFQDKNDNLLNNEDEKIEFNERHEYLTNLNKRIVITKIDCNEKFCRKCGTGKSGTDLLNLNYYKYDNESL